MKILTVVGARPQFIKLAPLSKELRKHFTEVIVHTGQHYDIGLSKVFFDALEIPKPDYNLEIGSGENEEQIKKIILRLKKVLIKEKPDLVLVYGDTNSTLGGALCSSELKIPIGHIEAGMRSYNNMPEEKNRVETDKLSSLFFCSTPTAVDNLKKERITKNVFLVGDVMIDALIQNIKIAEGKSKILENLDIVKKKYMLATIHRAENTDNKQNLKRIIEALVDSGEKIILPLHPRTKKSILKYSLNSKLDNSQVTVIEPLPYLDMLAMEKNAKKILTDSGGMQKEAYFFNVPCITMREVTEWTETVDWGLNLLVGSDKEKIMDAISNFEGNGKTKPVYGKGDASKKIVEEIIKFAESIVSH